MRPTAALSAGFWGAGSMAHTLLPGKILPSMKEALVALERPQGRVPTTQLLPMGALPGWQVAQLQAETQAALCLVLCRMSLHLAVGHPPKMTWTLASGPG